MRSPVEVNRIVYNALGAVKILLLVRCLPLRKSFPGPVLLLYYPHALADSTAAASVWNSLPEDVLQHLWCCSGSS